MLKKMFVLIISLTFIFAGCSKESSNTESGASVSDLPSFSNEASVSEASSEYETTEELLWEISIAKFSEFAWAKRGLESVTEFFEPFDVKQDFDLYMITVAGSGVIAPYYEDSSGVIANFIIEGTFEFDNVHSHFGRGAIAEYVEEHNGITYGITEWNNRDGEFDGYIVSWRQHGRNFGACLPADFTLPDIFAFCNAVPITTWELSGDAVSVSIQGMEEVGVIDGEGMEIIAEDDVLYRVDGGGMERIGYRWLTDEGAERYQYVLEPGEYQFSAVGGGSGAELLVKHFEAGEVVSELDYTETVAGKAGSRFILTVSGDPGETAIDLIDE